MPMDQDMSWGVHVLARVVGHGGQKILPYPLSIHEKACDFMYAFNESRIYVRTYFLLVLVQLAPVSWKEQHGNVHLLGSWNHPQQINKLHSE